MDHGRDMMMMKREGWKEREKKNRRQRTKPENYEKELVEDLEDKLPEQAITRLSLSLRQ